VVALGLAIGGAGGWWLTTPDTQREDMAFRVSAQVSETIADLGPKPRPYRYFSGCNDARAAGYESIRIDEPSYRPEMDGDGDGVACEPYYGG